MSEARRIRILDPALAQRWVTYDDAMSSVELKKGVEVEVDDNTATWAIAEGWGEDASVPKAKPRATRSRK